jgi:hypothetical protein
MSVEFEIASDQIDGARDYQEDPIWLISFGTLITLKHACWLLWSMVCVGTLP